MYVSTMTLPLPAEIAESLVRLGGRLNNPEKY